MKENEIDEVINLLRKEFGITQEEIDKLIKPSTNDSFKTLSNEILKIDFQNRMMEFGETTRFLGKQILKFLGQKEKISIMLNEIKKRLENDNTLTEIFGSIFKE